MITADDVKNVLQKIKENAPTEPNRYWWIERDGKTTIVRY